MTSRMFLLSLFLISAALADDAIDGWIADADYDPAIPTYTETLGYAPGEALTGHREMLRYFQTLAAASDRVILRTYGQTYQGRDLVTAVVSSPEHIAGLDQIVEDLQILADPRKSGDRDWFPLTQQESRHKIEEVRHWNPQVLVDFHEMGYRSTYYFPPPAEAINVNITARIVSWWDVFGKANARAFDERGWTYFTREVFDAFYPGYGESWPALNGAVGMTYEQASAEGRQIERPDGHVLTLEEAVQHHFLTGVTTVVTAAGNRRKLLQDFQQHFRDGMDQGRKGAVREYILPLDPESRVNLDLAAVLQRAGLEIRQAQEPFSNRRLTTFRGQPVKRKTFDNGTLIIPTNQPRYILLKALFEPHTPMDEAFIKEELERHKERLPDRIYDVTAWSLPFAYDARVYIAGEPSKVKTGSFDAVRGLSGYSRIAGVTENVYAYLIPYASHYALAALAHLWREEVKVHISREPFTQNGRPFSRGSLVVFPSGNGPDLPRVMELVASAHPVDVIATTTGWMDQGVNLGSRNVVYLKRPKVLILYPERPVSSYSYGAAAWLMEQAYGLPFTAVWPSRLGNIDLHEYDVLILPHAWGSYGDVLGNRVMSKVKAWVRGGGTLIGLKGGAVFLTGDDLGLTSVLLVDDVRPEEQTREKIKAHREKGEKVPHAHRPKSIPGAIFEVRLNRYHYLSYGYDEDTYVHIQSSYIFLPSEEGMNVAVFPKGGGKVSGFAWDGADSQLSEKVFLVDEHVGEGHVILFADDPNFRGYWRGLSKLFLNAVMLSPSLRR